MTEETTNEEFVELLDAEARTLLRRLGEEASLGGEARLSVMDHVRGFAAVTNYVETRLKIAPPKAAKSRIEEMRERIQIPSTKNSPSQRPSAWRWRKFRRGRARVARPTSAYLRPSSRGPSRPLCRLSFRRQHLRNRSLHHRVRGVSGAGAGAGRTGADLRVRHLRVRHRARGRVAGIPRGAVRVRRVNRAHRHPAHRSRRRNAQERVVPWSEKDAERHTKKAKTPRSRRAFAHAANSVLERTGDEEHAVRAPVTPPRRTPRAKAKSPRDVEAFRQRLT